MSAWTAEEVFMQRKGKWPLEKGPQETYHWLAQLPQPTSETYIYQMFSPKQHASQEGFLALTLKLKNFLPSKMSQLVRFSFSGKGRLGFYRRKSLQLVLVSNLVFSKLMISQPQNCLDIFRTRSDVFHTGVSNIKFFLQIAA